MTSKQKEQTLEEKEAAREQLLRDLPRHLERLRAELVGLTEQINRLTVDIVDIRDVLDRDHPCASEVVARLREQQPADPGDEDCDA